MFTFVTRSFKPRMEMCIRDSGKAVSLMRMTDGTKLPETVSFTKLKESEGRRVSLNACVHKIRNMSGFSFVILRTGQLVIQCVYEPQECEDDIEKLSEGMYIEAFGIPRAEPRAEGGVEIKLTGFKILSAPKAPYPLQDVYKRQGIHGLIK